jgi:hypothetical protein
MEHIHGLLQHVPEGDLFPAAQSRGSICSRTVQVKVVASERQPFIKVNNELTK